MRRVALISLAAVAAAALVSGCGAQGVTAPTPETVVGSLPKPTLAPETAAFKLTGNPAKGKVIFTKAGCVGCHTLADSHATGTVGPNLDQAKPDYRLATARVTLGKGAMPPFKGQLTDQQIADVAIVSRTLHLAALSACWRLETGREAGGDLDVAAYWLADQAPGALRTCHHLHGGTGMDVTYPLHRYSALVKDLVRLVGGADYRLDRLGARVCAG